MMHTILSMTFAVSAMGGAGYDVSHPDVFHGTSGAQPSAFQVTELTTPQGPMAARWTADDAALQRSQDPADTLFRSAQRALRSSDNERAAALFRTVRTRYPRSSVASDAGYWESFALQRVGGQQNLATARRVLQQQQRDHPDAATATDARALLARIDGQLARRGNEQSARDLVQRAEQMGQSCPSEDEDERLMVLDALLNMDSERALPTLKTVLARRDECSAALRRKAVFLVSQKGSGETEDILLNTLRTDPDQEVREQAVFWLGQTNSDKSTTALLNLLTTSRDTELLEKVVFSLSQQRSARAGTALREMVGNADVPIPVRAQAIFWLGQRNRDANATVQFLTELYGTLDNAELKEKTLFALSQRKTPASQRFLRTVALNPREPLEVRTNAIFHASQAGLTVPDLLEIYRGSTNTEIREQVIFAVSNQRSREAVDALFEIASNDPDRAMRSKAIFWIGESKDPRAEAFLLRILEKPPELR